MSAIGEADLVIEAATENMELKIAVFAQLDALCKSDTILASNTSSLSITRLAAATRRPDRVIGLHFFNPVAKMPLVEVIKSKMSNQKDIDLFHDFIEIRYIPNTEYCFTIF